MKEFAATYNANRHLALYLKTGDGLLIWRAYQEFRKAGLPVPEEILKKIDQFAESLSTATNPESVADAIEMKTYKGGASGFKRTVASEKQRDIVEYVHHRIKYGKNITKEKVYREAANKFRTTSGRVKTLYCSKWPNL